MERFAEEGFAPLGRPAREFYGPIFGSVQAMIFVSSVGLAVREVAPHLKSKATDPAVLVLDELGQYVIPVLSGHIGGANELAKALAASLGAQAVITTATDINGRFSVDAWAVQNGCAIASLPLAKAVSAAVLEGDVPFLSDFPVVTDLPARARARAMPARSAYTSASMKRRRLQRRCGSSRASCVSASAAGRERTRKRSARR